MLCCIPVVAYVGFTAITSGFAWLSYTFGNLFKRGGDDGSIYLPSGYDDGVSGSSIVCRIKTQNSGYDDGVSGKNTLSLMALLKEQRPCCKQQPVELQTMGAHTDSSSGCCPSKLKSVKTGHCNTSQATAKHGLHAPPCGQQTTPSTSLDANPDAAVHTGGCHHGG